MTDTATDDATAPVADATDAQVDTTEPPAADTPDPAAEIAKWKALARKHEQRSQANSKAAEELEALRVASRTDTERAIAEAEKQGRQAATAEFAQRLVAAELRAALTGVVPDPQSIIEDLNLGKYVTDTGDVDTDAVQALRGKYAAFNVKPPSADLKQGATPGGSATSQLTEADMNRMSPAQIVAAKAAGRFNDLLGIKT